ncbi:unnamed protein product [Orchesella dallaii]|uniref:Uncharacterized protein n=1 Tax=Orchesella dallaii TaxID=48710 RepID=A0ABP1Q987_9HEXA
MNFIENANVFCISLNGVVEGHQFLSLVTCRLSNINNSPKRTRTSSLPSYLEVCDEPSDRKNESSWRLQRSSRCLSEDSVRIRKDTLKTVCTKCIYSMVRKGRPVSQTKLARNRKFDLIVPKKKYKTASSKCKAGLRGSACTAFKDDLKIKKGAGIHKSLINHQKRPFGIECSGTSFEMDGYLLSYFISEIKRSQTFRLAFLRRWCTQYQQQVSLTNPIPQKLLVLVAIMKRPDYEILDSLGNKMVNSNILYRRSLEHALSWLSTLGGAFSALGDLSSSWAEEAGHVSITQLRIAMKLEDPGIKSRCRIYAAISLLQRGYLKSCRDIVRNEYLYAVSLPDGSDPRLRRMCLGVWAKLQYHWKQVPLAERNRLKSTKDGLQDIRNNVKYRNVYNLEKGRKIVSVEEASS